MGWLEESRALRSSSPDASGLERLGRMLAEPVWLLEQLHGGVASSTHALATPTRQLVLKRYGPEDETAALEWDRLRVAAAARVPTPEPVALDADGEWFGRPALVMTRLPGAVVYPPEIDALAGALAAIHDTVVPEPAAAAVHRPPSWSTWEEKVPFPAGVATAIRELQAIAGAEPTVLAHCDFHPGNVLVEDGAVTGVVDWSSARLVARGFDVALMRCDLAIEPGGDAPDRFLAAYEAASGVRVALLPLWDVFAAARALQHGDGWLDAWTDVGMNVTAEQVHDRSEAFAMAALNA